LDPWREFWEQQADEARDEAAAADPVARFCDYVSFVSWSKGRGRKRERPVEVELVGYDGRFVTLKDFPTNVLERIAQEVLSEHVNEADFNLYEEFLRRVRALANGRPQ
jgi:hypothetical protein